MSTRARADRDREPTPFEKRVYDAVKRIPRGRVATYKAVAAYVGCGSCRAVGQALMRNPYAPKVPCHRIISSDLSIGGFQGRRRGSAIGAKRRLLATEGVRFREGRLVAGRDVMHAFPRREPRGGKR